MLIIHIFNEIECLRGCLFIFPTEPPIRRTCCTYLQRNRMPSWSTNCIDDWEAKVDAIVEETLPENMTVISGIPPWVQMYFEKLQEKTGKNIGDIFPEFNLFIYGGVNYEPYRKKFENLIGTPR